MDPLQMDLQNLGVLRSDAHGPSVESAPHRVSGTVRVHHSIAARGPPITPFSEALCIPSGEHQLQGHQRAQLREWRGAAAVGVSLRSARPNFQLLYDDLQISEIARLRRLFDARSACRGLS